MSPNDNLQMNTWFFLFFSYINCLLKSYYIPSSVLYKYTFLRVCIVSSHNSSSYALFNHV